MRQYLVEGDLKSVRIIRSRSYRDTAVAVFCLLEIRPLVWYENLKILPFNVSFYSFNHQSLNKRKGRNKAFRGEITVKV